MPPIEAQQVIPDGAWVQVNPQNAGRVLPAGQLRLKYADGSTDTIPPFWHPVTAYGLTGVVGGSCHVDLMAEEWVIFALVGNSKNCNQDTGGGCRPLGPGMDPLCYCRSADIPHLDTILTTTPYDATPKLWAILRCMKPSVSKDWQGHVSG